MRFLIPLRFIRNDIVMCLWCGMCVIPNAVRNLLFLPTTISGMCVIPNAVRNLLFLHTTISGMCVIPNAMRNILLKIANRMLSFRAQRGIS